MDFIFTKVKVAPGVIFPEQEVIIIQLAGRIRNTQVTCRRCCNAREAHICQ